MSTTRITRRVRAPRARVYRAFTDAGDIATWRVPNGMTSRVHAFEPHVGGRFRVTLTYDDPARAGKTSGQSDTYHGQFVELVPPARIVEALAFETADPALQGEMRITVTLSEVAGGTEIVAVHDGVPDAVPPADNELGWRLSLDKLAKLVEGQA